jgi:hypothetical protein
MSGEPHPRASVEICPNAWNDPAAPAWIDVSDRVADGDDEPGWEVTEGRVNSLDVNEPGRLRLALRNNDDAFTIGNPASPYYPWWGQSARIRLYETFAYERAELFDGFVQWPTVTVNVAGTHQLCAVSAVDRLGWLQSAPRFVSTLGAHIMGDPSLVAYYPLHESYHPYTSLRQGGVVTPKVVVQFTPSTGHLADMVHPADELGPPGDDVDLLRLSYPVSLSTGATALAELVARLSLTVSSGQSLAVSAWVRPGVTGAGAVENSSVVLALQADAGDAYIGITNDEVTPISQGALQAGAPPTYDVLVDAGPLPIDVWRLVTVKVSLPDGTVDYWVGADTPGTPSVIGTPPSSMTFDEIRFGDAFFGAIGHVQVHLGDGDVFTHADHLAQHRVGLEGLEGQLTGERVRTLCGYAGLPPGLVKADRGTVRMSAARLAGKTPLTALREAETTEQGRLFCGGTENIIFYDRRRGYDI